MLYFVVLAISAGVALCSENIILNEDTSGLPPELSLFKDANQSHDQRDVAPSDDLASKFQNHSQGLLSRRKRSYNSQPVDDFDYPYVVSLRLKNEHMCGGTILTPRLILTAAHCVTPPAPTLVVVSNDATKTKDSYKVLRAIPHQFYRSHRHGLHDVAILVLRENIRNPQPVKLQQRPKRVPNLSEAYALGWGKTENSAESDQLRRVDVPLLFPKDCREHYGYSHQWVCIDSKQGNVCNGDSGGPLMFDGNQIGITSMGLGWTATDDACGSGRPSVFTRVSAYFGWIRQVVLRLHRLG